MDYVLFRLGIRNLIFLIGLIVCIIYIVRKRKFIYAIYFKKDILEKEYKGRNDIKLLRCLNVFPFITLILVMLFLTSFVLDIPNIVNERYACIEGYTVEKSHGGADVSSEKRSIWIQDEVSNKTIEITVFSKYIDANEYLKVQYLPHTKYGVVLER